MKTKEIYTLRNSFSIVGLTGRTGSGCTRFANIISKDITVEIENKNKEIDYVNSLIISVDIKKNKINKLNT